MTHHEQGNHGAYEMNHSGGHGMGHGDASEYLRKFYAVTVLLVPLLLANSTTAAFLGVSPLPYAKWVSVVVVTIIFWFSLVFFKHASHEIKARQYGMMTLVSIAVSAGYLFSLTSAFIPSIEAEFYLEISTLVWVLLFGHYLEARSSSIAGNALQEVSKLLPKKAHVRRGEDVVEVAVSDLREGDTVLVKPGEKIPADGVVVSGSSGVNESHISGESRPVAVDVGSQVVAGSICIDGSLSVELTRVGEHSTVGQIKQLVAKAQTTKPRSQRIADKAAGYLTFIAAGVAVLTLLVWTLVVGETVVFAMTLAITVLVIACPHALGLAIPTVTTITTSLALKNGLFVKDLSKIEVIHRADYVVFDKTGTLTEGSFAVRDIVTYGEMTKERALSIIAGIERHSSHVIGHAIMKYANENNGTLALAEEVKNVAGKGMHGIVDGVRYAVGSANFVEEYSNGSAEIAEHSADTLVYLATKEEVVARVALSDQVKSESLRAIERLHSYGLKVAMITGDNELVAKDVAKSLKIDTYFAEVLPEEKFTHIKALQEKGNVVLMVGDGVNDAPALTQADVGIAIGAGTDVAVEAGDVVLTENNPEAVARLVALSGRVHKKMIQNLVWALGYNVVAIPAAAGVFAPWGFYLRPEIGALLMSLSTVIVVVNALLLRRVRLN